MPKPLGDGTAVTFDKKPWRFSDAAVIKQLREPNGIIIDARPGCLRCCECGLTCCGSPCLGSLPGAKRWSILSCAGECCPCCYACCAVPGKSLPADRDTPIVVHCMTGQLSSKWTRYLEKSGYTSVVDGQAIMRMKQLFPMACTNDLVVDPLPAPPASEEMARDDESR